MLAVLVADVVAGRDGMAWLHGEPRIGESTLVDLMEQEARAAGARDARAPAEELAQTLPPRVLAECLGVPSSAPPGTSP
jgi:hypothetical protein